MGHLIRISLNDHRFLLDEDDSANGRDLVTLFPVLYYFDWTLITDNISR